ncbi:MAG: hypothetical protein DRH51_07645 [Candidatus Coatesbacteria bacterium]|nr:MAG: hypothetical protein DRH51_07645 [Candidatus Coatesbacteria bacterium]RLC40459.1 MAG: hypothetical protein DRH49_07115 [Candidatus Coatesbacteria bacterium]
MKYNIILFIILTASFSYAVPGDTIDTWCPSGNSNPRGLARIWDENAIWVAGPVTNNNCTYAKLDNIDHSILQDWQQLSGAYWCMDIGYPYMYDNKETIIVIDSISPRLKLYDPDDGSYLGYIPDPFDSGIIEGCGSDLDTNNVYVSNYSSTIIKEWNGSSWGDFTNCPGSPCMGVAVGWGHVMVITAQYDYSIHIFSMDGDHKCDIDLQSWGTQYMVGLCCAHENIVGGNESVYTAVYYPDNCIKEIEIEDIWEGTVAPSSVGGIKAIFH